jgi:hypothetical protein
MKKIFASVGVVALGATAVSAGVPAGAGMIDSTKPWSISATLRGFYDDNYVTAPKGLESDTLGFEISPSIALSLPLDQTTMGLRYTYGATWYQDRADLTSSSTNNVSNDAWDQTHQIDAYLNHQFSERYTFDVMDSFVIAQEPALLASDSSGFTFPYRTEGNNIRNHGQATFNGALSRQLSLVLGYQNTYYDYENDGGNAFSPSLSGLLDRMEHLALVNLRWQALPETVVVLGYNYGQVGYLSTETIAFIPVGPSTDWVKTSEIRNNRSHYVYAGFDQNFAKDLLLTVRGGAQMIDYYNDPTNPETTSPYGAISLTYTYLPGSSLQLGWTYSHNQTDVLEPDPTTGSVTSDQLSSVLYGSVHHRFTSKLSGTLSGNWQTSEFNGGLYDGQSESYYGVGASLAYRFDRHFTGEVGYNFVMLDSDIPNRDYDRNRVHLGVTAAY